MEIAWWTKKEHGLIHNARHMDAKLKQVKSWSLEVVPLAVLLQYSSLGLYSATGSAADSGVARWFATMSFISPSGNNMPVAKHTTAHA